MKAIIDAIAIIVLLSGLAGCSPITEQVTSCNISETVTRSDGSQYQVDRTC